jgi:hypothetical protein
VSAVADLLKKCIITQRDANNSKPEATSRRNTKVDCKTQTEANSRQRDRANADDQETVRRLEDKNGELSLLVEEYERKIVLLNEEMEQVLRDRTYHIQHIKERYEEENRHQMLKMRDMRDELLWYKKQLAVAHTSDEIISQMERRTPPTERDKDQQQSKRSDNTRRREARGSSSGQQLTNQRHCPDERDLSRERNLPPCLQNRNLPPHLQNRNLPPHLKQAPFRNGRV